MKEALYFVMDVESIGLHGEPYAVGYVVVDEKGTELLAKSLAIHPERAYGDREDREWVMANIPPIPVSHNTPEAMFDAFLADWLEWKAKGALLCADCAWPVEARFLAMCAGRNWPQNKWNGPYPLIDIGSVIFAKGGDPLATFDRLESELPKHNPLADARQSARVLLDFLAR